MSFWGDIGSDISSAANEIASDASQFVSNPGKALQSALGAIPGAAILTGTTPLQTLIGPIGASLEALGDGTNNAGIHTLGADIISGDITLADILLKDPKASSELLAGGAAIATGQPEVAVPAFAAAAQQLVADFNLPSKGAAKTTTQAVNSPPPTQSTVTTRTTTVIQRSAPMQNSATVAASSPPAPTLKPSLLQRFIAWFKAEF